MNSPLSASPAWKALLAHRDARGTTTASALWKQDPVRGERFAFECAGLAVDFSKQPASDETLALLVALARDRGLPRAIERLFAGEAVNVTEQRAAMHMALRGDEAATVGGQDIRVEIAREREHFRTFVDGVRDGRWRGATGEPVRAVVAIGIGGSASGPQLALEALAPLHDGPQVRFIVNVDPADLDRALAGLDPATTLLVVISKTFTTEETLANANACRAWIEAKLGSGAIAKHAVAATARPDRAAAWGLPECNVFSFAEWIGGRYSMWSSVGLPIALGIGMPAFERLLAGAHAVDLHFRSAPLERNVPALLGLLGIWNRDALGAVHHVMLPYASRLEGLILYLQQLEMESNGKRVDADGKPMDVPTVPAVWGGVGTVGQHSFHQWLHQGTEAFAADFIVVAKPMGEDAAAHARLVAHACAQSEAMMDGVSPPEPWRVCPGGRASTTIVLPALDPHALGALLAIYEHKVFAQATVWGINPFDQFGVELGKVLAGKILPAVEGKDVPVEPATRHLIGLIHKLAQTH